MSDSIVKGRTYLLLPAQARNLAPKLLDQQMWCWGCDIRRPEGNLLSAYGLVKLSAPEGVKQSSAYTLCFTDGAQVTLWAFGAFYGAPERGGIFVKRGGFTALYTPIYRLPIAEWTPPPEAELPATAQKCANAAYLLSAFSAWIADYETWIAAQTEPEYRAACVNAWFAHKRAVPSQAMISAWRNLAEACRHALILT
ncbi:MAG: hypothetical protein CUN49_07920 [Candidatus Thermofonsia Clade 1 bacterium]|jgi:hypothetical protein|uniref:Uncharacterized protein n=1 Tax=Candidatus Thermofonsia Clade 1 bacterium TaxID=2364210 RepID=A0A2M8PEG8_9CHLR|nr:MAG: hypothetical protein CUN49_07920 [Candidatus Thermofonsia Clade 1 bacterium]RMF51392.1 MAG: hypothetical protein D6749_07895 [Chloroflexota bacterium]